MHLAINEVCLNLTNPLGIFLVSGINLVPRPAAIIKA